MAFLSLKFLLVASVWCSSGILGYNVHRIDNENGQPANVEIDFYSSYEAKKFLDELRKSADQHINFDQDSTQPPAGKDSTPLDSWSVVWYIASFGGLIVFFLIVSCSEWCCRRAIRNSGQTCSRNAASPAAPAVPDTPPPSYDHFAPPSYESICLGRRERGCEKSEYDIYVVPVHALGTIIGEREGGEEDAPPSYLSAQTGARLAPVTFEDDREPRVT